MLYIDGKKVTKARTPGSVKNADKQAVYDFLQGAVYCWCNANEKAKFNISAFVGGKNWDWGGTPLKKIYKHYMEKYNNDHYKAYNQSKKDAGLLLQEVLIKDGRRFDRKTSSGYAHSAEYAWDGQHPQKT